MNYVEIVNLVFDIIFGIYSLLMIHFAIFFVVGIFKKKKYPQTKVINKYGIIIPARNEELVVGNLIESIQKCNYPQDKLQIFVIAHNCTDKTAEVARKYGVTVYEYNNPNECTMGFAFKYLFEQIERDYKTSSYDGFFLFNADNVVDENYFNKMNDAFEYWGHKCVVTSFRNSKNWGSNLISSLYGIYFAVGCIFESRGRTLLGCSTRVQGTGYVISSNLVKNGWPYTTLTEDWEFTADQIIAGNKIKYCDEAVFYDEQPTNLHIMWRQRVRWARGHLLVFYARTIDLIKKIFSKKHGNKFSLYDFLTNILPFCLILFGLKLIQLILMSIGPLIFNDVSFENIFLGMGYELSSFGSFIAPIFGGEQGLRDTFGSFFNLFFNNGYLWAFTRSIFIYSIGCFLWVWLIYFLERKRIKNVSFGIKLLSSIFWPLFLFIQFVIDIQALFSRNLGWKPIPHDDKTRIHNLK